MEERAAAALEAREAPTQAQVSSSDRGASKGRSLFTALGRTVLHTSPANHVLTQACLCQFQALETFIPHMNWALHKCRSQYFHLLSTVNCLSDCDGHVIGNGCAHMSGTLLSKEACFQVSMFTQKISCIKSIGLNLPMQLAAWL